jgi:hypothetical protein
MERKIDGFEPSDLDRPGRQPHQQGLCEARLGCRDGSSQLEAAGRVRRGDTGSGEKCVPPRRASEPGRGPGAAAAGPGRLWTLEGVLSSHSH